MVEPRSVEFVTCWLWVRVKSEWWLVGSRSSQRVEAETLEYNADRVCRWQPYWNKKSFEGDECFPERCVVRVTILIPLLLSGKD